MKKTKKIQLWAECLVFRHYCFSAPRQRAPLQLASSGYLLLSSRPKSMRKSATSVIGPWKLPSCHHRP